MFQKNNVVFEKSSRTIGVGHVVESHGSRPREIAALVAPVPLQRDVFFYNSVLVVTQCYVSLEKKWFAVNPRGGIERAEIENAYILAFGLAITRSVKLLFLQEPPSLAILHVAVSVSEEPGYDLDPQAPGEKQVILNRVVVLISREIGVKSKRNQTD